MLGICAGSWSLMISEESCPNTSAGSKGHGCLNDLKAAMLLMMHLHLSIPAHMHPLSFIHYISFNQCGSLMCVSTTYPPRVAAVADGLKWTEEELIRFPDVHGAPQFCPCDKDLWTSSLLTTSMCTSRAACCGRCYNKVQGSSS